MKLHKSLTISQDCTLQAHTWASIPRWRHQTETFSALLALCAGNSPVTSEFRAKRLVTRSFDVCFDLRLNQQMSKQWRCRWFETPSRSLGRLCNTLRRRRLAGIGICIIKLRRLRFMTGIPIVNRGPWSLFIISWLQANTEAVTFPLRLITWQNRKCNHSSLSIYILLDFVPTISNSLPIPQWNDYPWSKALQINTCGCQMDNLQKWCSSLKSYEKERKLEKKTWSWIL